MTVATDDMEILTLTLASFHGFAFLSKKYTRSDIVNPLPNRTLVGLVNCTDREVLYFHVVFIFHLVSI